jgi:hypothetical protein
MYQKWCNNYTQNHGNIAVAYHHYYQLRKIAKQRKRYPTDKQFYTAVRLLNLIVAKAHHKSQANFPPNVE